MMRLKIFLTKKKLIKTLDDCIIGKTYNGIGTSDNSYDIATTVSIRLQEYAVWYWLHHKPIPLWIKKCLSLYNLNFGFMKQNDEWGDEWEWK